MMNETCYGLAFYIEDVNSCEELTATFNSISEQIYKFKSEKNKQNQFIIN